MRSCLKFALSSTAVAHAGVSLVDIMTWERCVKIGEGVEETLNLQNNDEDDQEVKIYQNFSAKRFVLRGKSKKKIAYTLKVPGDPDLPGTYWSLLMVEGISASSPESLCRKRRKLRSKRRR